MDWYDLVKYLHVVSAVIWVGGALIMVILGIKADRAKSDTELTGVVLQVAWAGERVYVPASISTLLFGLIATWLGGLWGQLWVILGLVGVATTIGLGIGVLTPRAKRAQASFAAGGASSEVVSIAREILTIAKFDMVLLLTIIADMVLKPTPTDWPLLLIFAVVIAGAAVVFLMPMMRTRATA